VAQGFPVGNRVLALAGTEAPVMAPVVPTTDLAHVPTVVDAKIPAISEAAPKADAGQGSKIEVVGPVNPESLPEGVAGYVGKDGKLHLAQGVESGDRMPLYKIGIEAGATEQQIADQLAKLDAIVGAKVPAGGKKNEFVVDEGAQGLVSEGLLKQIRDHQFVPPNKDGKKDGHLDDEPNHGNKKQQPSPYTNPDGQQKKRKSPPEGDFDGDKTKPAPIVDPEVLKAQKDAWAALDRNTANREFQAISYPAFGWSILPKNIIKDLGPPPWDPKTLAEYLASNKAEFEQNVDQQAVALEKGGDADGAKALRDFGKMLTKADPATPEGAKLLQNFSTLMEKGHKGTITAEDVNRFFTGTPGLPDGLKAAFEHSNFLGAAKKADAKFDGDISKLSEIAKQKIFDSLSVPMTPGPKRFDRF
jgi:hypothetical protein